MIINNFSIETKITILKESKQFKRYKPWNCFGRISISYLHNCEGFKNTKKYLYKQVYGAYDHTNSSRNEL